MFNLRSPPVDLSDMGSDEAVALSVWMPPAQVAYGSGGTGLDGQSEQTKAGKAWARENRLDARGVKRKLRAVKPLILFLVACIAGMTATGQLAGPKYVTGNANQVLAVGGTITTGQATLGASAAQIVPALSTRRSVAIRNHDAAITIYVGPSGVTTGTGFIVRPNEAVTIRTTAAIFAVATSGTPVVSYLSEND